MALQEERKEKATRVVHRLRDSGFQAYLVGGCVRDLLLEREPADYDVATDALPDQVVGLFARTQTVGAQFGVVLVHESGEEIAVATFRSDAPYLDGRHPVEVTYTGSAREDVQRRDFTINGLLYDPVAQAPEEHRIIDYVGGRADLQVGLIRAIGSPEHRFAEDRLRMLRAIRFAARFNFHIEHETWEAIRRLGAGILRVSRERIRDELIRVLAEGGARRGFELLDGSGLLKILLPEVAAMKGVPQPPEFHPEGDVWTHTLIMLGEMKNPTPTLALAVLLHDVGKPSTFRVADRIRFDNHAPLGARMAEAVCERFRLSRRDTQQVAALVENHLRFKDVAQMRPAKLKRFLQMENFEEHLELHRLDCISSHGYLDNWEFVKRKLEETPPEEIRPKPLITGDDLIAAGYVPGPRFKEMLQAAEEAQLEGEIHTRQEALELVRRRFPR
jgi:poly(A) polymerase